MRVFRRLLLLAAMAVAIAGCAGPANRNAVLDELNPAPMSVRAWSHVAGTYMGPVHASTDRFGYEGYSAMETRLDLSGWPDAPGVVLRVDKGFSTSWTPYGEWHGVYTNIPSKVYGSQGEVIATTHAPNQLLLVLRRNGVALKKAGWLILTFLPDGKVDAEWVGRSGWRGQGELWRATTPQDPE